ncbi:MAG: chemotaxis protein CheA [Pseudomonadota bacterium]
MSFDLSQFRQVFFDESFEGLELAEAGLLGLQRDGLEPDAINEIFRAIHSLKGGSGTFGLSSITELAHQAETILDHIRNGTRAPDGELIALLLRAVDELRAILTDLHADPDKDCQPEPELLAALESALHHADDATPLPPNAVSEIAVSSSGSVESASVGWRIEFLPNLDLFATGNEPSRILRELAELGAVDISMAVDAVPGFSEIEPENCYVSWTIELRSTIEEAPVREAFSWVEGLCDLSITRLGAEVVTEAPATSAADQSSSTTAPTTSQRDSGSIRVSIQKVDELINMVGELVITQSMLGQFRLDGDADRESLVDGLAQLERNTRELQENVLQIRMLPISFCFSRFPRLIYDLSRELGKKVELRVEGEQTELDKTVLERISDPLVHLLRNALDHGIETPAERVAVGKPETGQISLNAYHAGGNIVIEIMDDGRGIDFERVRAKARTAGLAADDDPISDERAKELIFEAGLSTADTVSNVSGRGVGMDVVRENIKGFGGTIEVSSEQAVGTKFTIRLPLTLAILDGQLVRVGETVYVISLLSIIESVQGQRAKLSSLGGSTELYSFRDEYVQVVRLHSLFNVRSDTTEIVDGLLVLVEADGERIALFVDELLGQQQVVVKSLDTNYRNIPGLSGATILGNGTVALILDVPGVVRSQRMNATERATQAA